MTKIQLDWFFNLDEWLTFARTKWLIYPDFSFTFQKCSYWLIFTVKIDIAKGIIVYAMEDIVYAKENILNTKEVVLYTKGIILYTKGKAM